VVLADSGALYALVDRKDVWHDRVRTWWLSSRAREIRCPVTILPEVAYLLGQRIGPPAEAAFTQAVAAGEFVVEALHPEDTARAAELTAADIDLPLGFVDATLVAIAERLGTRAILTTDRRHFSLIRPQHTPAFQLLP
jgi:predicted nucleic acid-binding protein